MSMSNFKVIKTTSQGIFATVDVTTPRLFGKPKTEERGVCLLKGCLFWVFMDTGEYTPGTSVESLYKLWQIEGLKP